MRVIAFIGLIICSPIMIIIYFILKMETKGSAIFKQVRVGREGEGFTCLKFRTMHVGTSNVPTHEVSPSSITRFGKILRITKLDELPQLINVIRGHMAFVGPRPCLETQTDLIEERRKRGVLKIKPGITGLAQVRGVDMSTPLKLARYDSVYAKNSNICFDCEILIRTFLMAIKR